MAKKIEHVHKIWANTHSGPPHGAAEDKEYDALMQKFVGHPDVSSFMEKKK